MDCWPIAGHQVKIPGRHERDFGFCAPFWVGGFFEHWGLIAQLNSSLPRRARILMVFMHQLEVGFRDHRSESDLQFKRSVLDPIHMT